MTPLSRTYSTQYSAYQRRQSASDLQRALADSQQELATGRKSDVYRALGTSAAETLNLRASLQRDEAQLKANTLLLSRMETSASALSSIRDQVQGVLDLAAANSGGQTGTVSGLQQAAQAALGIVTAQANLSHAGMPLFSGTGAPAATVQPWQEVNAATGRSPAGAMGELLSGGLATEADAAARVAAIDAAFAGNAADPTLDFEATFYNGSPGGAPRLEADTGDAIRVQYGVQANDPGFRDVLKGLSMLAAADPAEISDAQAYKTWIGAATQALGAGTTALLADETRVGVQMAQVETLNQRMKDRAEIFTNRILDLEGVDEYEAATRISQLQTRLQASYAVTARLSQLSFLNYMR